uniref:flagellar protein FlhE n=1 Tax=Pantoea sp. TaxID=69393 RepID=UPI00289C0246
ALPATAELHHIAWRISLLSPPPPGLQIKLCSQQRCLPLPTLVGQRDDPAPLTAQGPFYFVYSVESRGALLPPLNVVKNQLTLNYR